MALKDQNDTALVEAIHRGEGFDQFEDSPLLASLSELHHNGFLVEKPGPGSRFGARLDPVALYYYLNGGTSHRVVLRETMASPRISIKSAEDVVALNFFEGSELTDGLSQEKTALQLRQRLAEGWDFSLRPERSQTPLEVYRQLVRRPSSLLWMETEGPRIPVDQTLLGQPEALEARVHQVAQILTHVSNRSQAPELLTRVYYQRHHLAPVEAGRTLATLLDCEPDIEAANESFLTLLTLGLEPGEGCQSYASLRSRLNHQETLNLLPLLSLPVESETLHQRTQLLQGLESQGETLVRDYLQAASEAFSTNPEQALHDLTVRWMLRQDEAPDLPQTAVAVIEEEEDLWIGDVHIARQT